MTLKAERLNIGLATTKVDCTYAWIEKVFKKHSKSNARGDKCKQVDPLLQSTQYFVQMKKEELQATFQYRSDGANDICSTMNHQLNCQQHNQR